MKKEAKAFGLGTAFADTAFFSASPPAGIAFSPGRDLLRLSKEGEAGAGRKKRPPPLAAADLPD